MDRFAALLKKLVKKDFGKPPRITGRRHLGESDANDIERKAKRSSHIYGKGVLNRWHGYFEHVIQGPAFTRSLPLFLRGRSWRLPAQGDSRQAAAVL